MSIQAEALFTAEEYDLPPGWHLATIGNLVEKGGIFIDGDWVESKDQDPEGDVRLIQLADIGDGEYKNKSARFLTSKKAVELGCTFLNKGDVLIARMPDPLGRACIFPGDLKRAVTVVDVAIVRSAKGEFDHRWLMYFINAPAFRAAIASMQSGSTRKRISRGNLAKIALPVPPLDQQKRIVAEIEKQFSRLDEAVANLKRVKANLKRYKATVLKAAVEGRLTKSLNGPILKRPLGSLGEWCGGGTPSKSKTEYWTGGTIPWVSPKDMKSDVISDSEDHITDTAIQDSTTNLVSAGSVLIVTRSGILRHTLPVAITSVPATINQDLKALQPAEAYDPGYVALALRASASEILHECSKEGTTVQSIEFPQFLRYEIPVPELIDQRTILREVDRRLSVIRETEIQVNVNLVRAENMRQSLLANASLGKIDQIDTTNSGGVYD